MKKYKNFVYDNLTSKRMYVHCTSILSLMYILYLLKKSVLAPAGNPAFGARIGRCLGQIVVTTCSQSVALFLSFQLE